MSEKIKPLRISAHPYENAIVIDYISETTDDNTGQVISEQKEIKIIPSIISSERNKTKLARKIVRRCKFISERWLDDVESILDILESRSLSDTNYYHDDDDGIDQIVTRRSDAGIIGDDKNEDECWDETTTTTTTTTPDRTMTTRAILDHALESMYGTNEEKVKASTNILKLCQKNVHSNLEHMVQHNQIMSALSRELHDYKSSSSTTSSTRLIFVLCKIFLTLSDFEELHPYLTEYRIGSLIMSVMDLETRRNEHHCCSSSSTTKDDTIGRVRGVGGGGGEQVQHQQPQQTIDNKKKQSLVKCTRNDNIMFVCMSILIRLSDDLTVLQKMLKKGLVPILLCSLHNNRSVHCLQTILVLLKRACIFEETVEEIVNFRQYCQVIHILVHLLSSSSSSSSEEQSLVLSSMKILYNLSFNTKCQCIMVDEAGIIPILITLMKKSYVRSLSVSLMYQLTIQSENRKFLYTTTGAGQFIPLLMQLIVNYPQRKISVELGALAVNASLEPLCAEEMITFIDKILYRIHKYEDVLLAKVLRNLSIWTRNLQMTIHQTIQSRDIIHLSKLTKKPSRYMYYKLPFNKNKEGIIMEEVNTLTATNNDDGCTINNSSLIDQQQQQQQQQEEGWLSKYIDCNIWNNHISQIASLCTTMSQNEDLVLELMGILNQMTIDDLPPVCDHKWSTFMTKHSLIPFIKKCIMMRRGGLNDNIGGGGGGGDLTMEAVILCDHILCDSIEDNDENEDEDDNACVDLIAASGIVQALVDIWEPHPLNDDDHYEDTELMIQLLLVCQSLLLFEKARLILLEDTDSLKLIFHYFDYSKNQQLQHISKRCLDVVQLYDRDNKNNGERGKFALLIQDKMFFQHNESWLMQNW